MNTFPSKFLCPKHFFLHLKVQSLGKPEKEKAQKCKLKVLRHTRTHIFYYIPKKRSCLGCCKFCFLLWKRGRYRALEHSRFFFISCELFDREHIMRCSPKRDFCCCIRCFPSIIVKNTTWKRTEIIFQSRRKETFKRLWTQQIWSEKKYLMDSIY